MPYAAIKVPYSAIRVRYSAIRVPYSAISVPYCPAGAAYSRSLGSAFIPNVGILYSQCGNAMFPTWEYHAPKAGISVANASPCFPFSRGLVEDK